MRLGVQVTPAVRVFVKVHELSAGTEGSPVVAGLGVLGSGALI